MVNKDVYIIIIIRLLRTKQQIKVNAYNTNR